MKPLPPSNSVTRHNIFGDKIHEILHIAEVQMAGNGWKWLDITRVSGNVWKLLELAMMALNLLDIPVYDQKWLEMAGHKLTCLEMAGTAEYGLKMAVNGCK